MTYFDPITCHECGEIHTLKMDRLYPGKDADDNHRLCHSCPICSAEYMYPLDETDRCGWCGIPIAAPFQSCREFTGHPCTSEIEHIHSEMLNNPANP